MCNIIIVLLYKKYIKIFDFLNLLIYKINLEKHFNYLYMNNK